MSPPQRVLGGIPDKINNNNMLDIRSHVTGGLDGGDQETVGGDGGGPAQPAGGHPGRQQTRQGPGGAIAARLQAIPTHRNDAFIERKLGWQSRVEGDTNKCTAFRDQAINQTKLLAFAFMKGKSPVVHMAHSIGQFFGMSGLAVDVQSKYIGFIGDRGNGRYPIPFLLPPQNAWAWAKVKYLNNMVAFDEHFDDASIWDKLWTPGVAEITLKEKLLPRLLALPTFVAEFINSQGGACLPHKLCSFVQDYINNGETQIQHHKWNLILDWCIVASQEKNKVSLLNIGTTNPALCQDQEFLDCCNQRIQITLGEEP